MGRDSIVQSYMTMKKQPLTNAMIVEGRTTKKGIKRYGKI